MCHRSRRLPSFLSLFEVTCRCEPRRNSEKCGGTVAPPDALCPAILDRSIVHMIGCDLRSPCFCSFSTMCFLYHLSFIFSPSLSCSLLSAPRVFRILHGVKSLGRASGRGRPEPIPLSFRFHSGTPTWSPSMVAQKPFQAPLRSPTSCSRSSSSLCSRFFSSCVTRKRTKVGRARLSLAGGLQ